MWFQCACFLRPPQAARLMSWSTLTTCSTSVSCPGAVARPRTMWAPRHHGSQPRRPLASDQRTSWRLPAKTTTAEPSAFIVHGTVVHFSSIRTSETNVTLLPEYYNTRGSTDAVVESLLCQRMCVKHSRCPVHYHTLHHQRFPLQRMHQQLGRCRHA